MLTGSRFWQCLHPAKASHGPRYAGANKLKKRQPNPPLAGLVEKDRNEKTKKPGHPGRVVWPMDTSLADVEMRLLSCQLISNLECEGLVILNRQGTALMEKSRSGKSNCFSGKVAFELCLVALFRRRGGVVKVWVCADPPKLGG